MRLAYLVSQYPAITHTFILREIRTLRSLGFDVDVVSIRASDRASADMSPEEKDESARTWAVLPQGLGRIAAAQFAVFLSRPGAYLRAFWSAVAIARLDLPATVSNLIYFAEAMTAGQYLHGRGIAHLHSHFSSNVAMWIPRVFPITFSATIHGPDEFNDASGFYLAEKVEGAHFLCAISQYARSQLMRVSNPRYWDKLEVSPLGVDPDQFTPRPHRELAEPFEIVSVGRLAPAKAQVVLVEAVAALIRQNRSVRLRIAGEGPERSRLQDLIARHHLQDYVILEGACSQERVRQLYRESDLFVLASFAEGVPVVLMEAMAMEIPCLSTWITGVPELIQHDVNGWLIPPSDVSALTDAMGHLMDHPDLRRRLGRAGRAQVEQNYNLRSNTEQLAAIYRRRLSNTRS